MPTILLVLVLLFITITPSVSAENPTPQNEITTANNQNPAQTLEITEAMITTLDIANQTYYGIPITLRSEELENIRLHRLLQLVSSYLGKKAAISDNIPDIPVNIHLNHTPSDKAFTIIAKAAELDYQEIGSTIHFTIKNKSKIPAKTDSKTIVITNTMANEFTNASTKEYNGDLISLYDDNIKLYDVMIIFAGLYEGEMVFSDRFIETINELHLNIHLDNIPWDKALAIILKATKTDNRVSGRAMLLATEDELQIYSLPICPF